MTGPEIEWDGERFSPETVIAWLRARLDALKDAPGIGANADERVAVAIPMLSLEACTALIAELERLLAAEREPCSLEIRLDDDGELDEIVGDGRFHLERMGGNDWHLTLGGLGMDLTGISGARPVDHEDWRAARDAVAAQADPVP